MEEKKNRNMNILIFGKPLEYILKMMSLWPNKSYVFGTVIYLSALITSFPFQTWALYQLKDEPLLLFDAGCSYIPQLFSYIKYFVFWINRSTLLDIIREMAEDYEKGDITEKWSGLIISARRFCKIDFSLYIATSTLYYLQVISLYFTQPIEGRVLMTVAYFPFDQNESPYFEIILLSQIMQGAAQCCIQVLSESLLVALVSHICGCTDSLFVEIQKYSDRCDKGDDSQSLKFVIEKYLKVLSLVNRVEQVYTYASLFQLFYSTLVLCIIGLVVISSKNVMVILRNIALLMAMVWQIHSFCFAGQHLMNETDAIPGKLYDICWYKAKPTEMKDIMFIIKRAQAPLGLTAVKLFPLSAQTFTSIMKTSFSYLSVLRATID